MFTDPDCVPHPGWLRGLLAALDAGYPLAAGAVEAADASARLVEAEVDWPRLAPLPGSS